MPEQLPGSPPADPHILLEPTQAYTVSLLFAPNTHMFENIVWPVVFL